MGQITPFAWFLRRTHLLRGKGEGVRITPHFVRRDPVFGVTYKKSPTFASLIHGLSFCLPYKSRLLTRRKKPWLLRNLPAFLFLRLQKQASDASEKENPALRAGLFLLLTSGKKKARR